MHFLEKRVIYSKFLKRGVVAKRSGSGLQNRLNRFDSDPRLHFFCLFIYEFEKLRKVKLFFCTVNLLGVTGGKSNPAAFYIPFCITFSKRKKPEVFMSLNSSVRSCSSRWDSLKNSTILKPHLFT